MIEYGQKELSLSFGMLVSLSLKERHFLRQSVTIESEFTQNRIAGKRRNLLILDQNAIQIVFGQMRDKNLNKNSLFWEESTGYNCEIGLLKGKLFWSEFENSSTET